MSWQRLTVAGGGGNLSPVAEEVSGVCLYVDLGHIAQNWGSLTMAVIQCGFFGSENSRQQLSARNLHCIVSVDGWYSGGGGLRIRRLTAAFDNGVLSAAFDGGV